jgi:cytochrome c-type biogenesis protein
MLLNLNMNTPTIGISFLAGLASFLSPCVLSLVPAYIGYLGGRSVAGNPQQSRWVTLMHGLAFVLGFSFVFVVVLGLPFSLLGSLLYDSRVWISRIGGIIVVVFGLHMTGLFRIPFLEYDLRPRSKVDQRRSFFSSAVMGMFFSLGWTPCTGPTLGTILTLAMAEGSVSLGVVLLSAYSAGLAIPFLLAALSIGWVTTILRRYGRLLHYIEIAMGVILIVVGLMLIFGVFELLARLFPFSFLNINL